MGGFRSAHSGFCLGGQDDILAVASAQILGGVVFASFGALPEMASVLPLGAQRPLPLRVPGIVFTVGGSPGDGSFLPNR